VARTSVRLAALTAFLTVVVAPLAMSGGGVSAAAADRGAKPPANDAAAKGLVMRDLRKADRGPCKGGYDVLRHPGLCTPGPDAAPEGVDVRAAQPGGGKGTTGGGKKTGPSPSPTVSPTVSPTTSPTSSPTASPSPSSSATSTAPVSTSPRCGTDGNRVQAVYAVASDVADSYAALLPSLQRWAAVADDVFARSAVETGGVRRIRYVTDESCNPTVLKVVLSPTGDDSLSNTITELRAAGLDRQDRKYMVWVDSNVYCGIGTIKGDDRPGADNANNFGPSFGRTDRACWGGQTEAHELMHNIGGVQLSAPHSTGAWHCTDEYDRMCYRENNATMSYVCPQEHDALFDCRHDDYYSTSPLSGTYLATHWNAASSVFLAAS